MKHFYSLTQVGTQDCGPTALKMLLAYLYQDERFLFIQETWERPSTFKQLLDGAIHFGLTLKAYKLHHPSSVRGIKKPFIALMKEPTNHYVTVIPHGKFFQILDPSGIQRKESLQYFSKRFSGYILLVKHYQLNMQLDLPMNHHRMAFFLRLSYGWFTLIVLLWFWQTVNWILFMVIITLMTLLWLNFLYQQIKKLDISMTKHYLALIHDPEQFKRFQLWKQGWFSLPINHLYRTMIITSTFIYVSFASTQFLLILAIFHLIMGLWIPKMARDDEQALRTITTLEQSLKYPHVAYKEFQHLSNNVYQVIHSRIKNWFVTLLLAVMLVWIYQQWIYFEAFLTWITMVSLLMINFHHHYELYRLPREKKEWRQLGFLFLNQKDYVKIKM